MDKHNLYNVLDAAAMLADGHNVGLDLIIPALQICQAISNGYEPYGFDLETMDDSLIVTAYRDDYLSFAPPPSLKIIVRICRSGALNISWNVNPTDTGGAMVVETGYQLDEALTYVERLASHWQPPPAWATEPMNI